MLFTSLLGISFSVLTASDIPFNHLIYHETYFTTFRRKVLLSMMNEDVMLVLWRKIKNQNMLIKLKANEYYDIVINSKRGQVINNTIDNTV